MKNLLRRHDVAVTRLFADVWQKDADAGHIAIIGNLDDDLCEILRAQVRSLAHREPPPPLHLFIDCTGTARGRAWPIILEIARYPEQVHAFVENQALSGGFSLCLAADYRVAVEGAQFAWHGPECNECGQDSIDAKVEFYAAQTKQSKDFWQCTLMDGQHHSIGTARARDWGLIHKIVPARYAREGDHHATA